MKMCCLLQEVYRACYVKIQWCNSEISGTFSTVLIYRKFCPGSHYLSSLPVKLFSLCDLLFGYDVTDQQVRRDIFFDVCCFMTSHLATSHIAHDVA